MRQLNTSWPPKLNAKIQFCCFSLIALSFAVVYLCFPETISLTGMLLEAIFVGAACFYGYQVFSHSDEWFWKKQENDIKKNLRWQAEHPVLYYLANYGAVFLVIGYSLIKIYLHKH